MAKNEFVTNCYVHTLAKGVMAHLVQILYNKVLIRGWHCKDGIWDKFSTL